MTAIVTVQGSASVPARPDTVDVALEVTYLATTAHDALSEVATRASQLEALLSELGVEERQWTTSGAAVTEQFEHNHTTGERVHRGFSAAVRIALRLEDASLIGRLMREATKRSQARVSGPWWRIAPDNPARIEACRAAAAEARRKAEAYASALGARLGVVIDISEPGLSVEPRLGRESARAMASMSIEAPSDINVHAGDLSVSATVIVRFALQQD